LQFEPKEEENYKGCLLFEENDVLAFDAEKFNLLIV